MKRAARISAGRIGEKPALACFCNLLNFALHSAFWLSNKKSLKKTVFWQAKRNDFEDL
jgi:hypothetical protein